LEILCGCSATEGAFCATAEALISAAFNQPNGRVKMSLRENRIKQRPEIDQSFVIDPSFKDCDAKAHLCFDPNLRWINEARSLSQ
jgi:hypothetical protein